MIVLHIRKFFYGSIQFCYNYVISQFLITASDGKEYNMQNYNLLAILFFIPAFGNGSASSETVTLFAFSGINSWVKTVFVVIIGITILNGICGVIVANFGKPVWNRHRLITGRI